MISLFEKPNRWPLGLALFGGLAICALAEDFTFNIPVELHKINPNIQHGFVNVVVYTKDYVPALQPYNESLRSMSRVTYGSADLQIANGEFVGTLVVKLNALSKTVPGRRAQDAVYYELNLVLNDSYYDHDTAGIRRMLDGTYGYDASQPFVYWASGPINPARLLQPIKRDKPPIIKR